MGQLGFFDADKRLERAVGKLSRRDRGGVLTPDELKKSGAGRKPFDATLMFRMPVLQALNNLSDEQVEYQVRWGQGRAAQGPRCALDQEAWPSSFGYQNHVNADAKHQLIRHYDRCGRARQPEAGWAVRQEPAMMCLPTALIGRPRSRPNSLFTTRRNFCPGANAGSEPHGIN
jgi:hypothetical protein